MGRTPEEYAEEEFEAAKDSLREDLLSAVPNLKDHEALIIVLALERMMDAHLALKNLMKGTME